MIKWICKYNNGDSAGETTFYDSSDTSVANKNKLLSGVIKREVNTAGQFVFEIHKSNSYYSKFKVLKTVVLCYGVDTSHSNRIVGNFLGRVKTIELGFEGIVKITCEDAFGVLSDAKDWMRSQTHLQESANNHTLVDALFNDTSGIYGGLLHSFNNLSGSLRVFFQFYDLSAYSVSGWETLDLDSSSLHILGVDDYSESYDRGWDNEASCLDSLEDYISGHGGYVVVEPITKTSTTSNVKLMWFPEYTSTSSLPSALKESQTLNFGTNILSVSKEVDSSEIFTRIYPFGKEDYWVWNGTTYTWEVADPNNMTDLDYFEPFPMPLSNASDSTPGYLEDSTLVSTYGVIAKSVIFENVKTQAQLTKKTQAYFKKYQKANANGNYAITATGLDLATVGKDKEPWHVGRYVKVTSDYHDISDWFMISAYEQNIFNPSKSKITFNNKPVRLTTKTKSTLAKQKKSSNASQTSANEKITDLYTTKVQGTTDDSSVTVASTIKNIVYLGSGSLPTSPDSSTLYLINEET